MKKKPSGLTFVSQTFPPIAIKSLITDLLALKKIEKYRNVHFSPKNYD